jgi:AraC-like DNA-binding protein
MTAVPLVRVNAISPFFRFFKQIGSPVDRLIAQSKLSVQALEDPEALILLYSAFDFFELGMRTEGVSLLGVYVGQQTQISDLGLFGVLLHQSLTLYDLLKTIERLLSSFSSGERFWMVEEGDRVWIHNTFDLPSNWAAHQGRFYSLLLYLKAVQLVTGSEWHPLEIHLETNRLKELGQIQEFANTRLLFNQPSSAIALQKSLLSLPLKQSIQASLSPQDYQLWLTSAPASNFTGSLQQIIQILLQRGYPEVEQVAEMSGISVRSLQRRLATENVSYSRLVDKVRFDMAIALLHQPNLPITDIAYELGYNDAANFTRAFKRWTGVSPREFRQMHTDIINI